MAGEQLTGPPRTLPFRTAALREALAASAAQYVHGSFERRRGLAEGALHFEIAIEDAATHKMTRTLALEGRIARAMDELAKSIDAGARPFSTTNEQAVEAWGKRDYQRAVDLDPGFSAAWLEWAQGLAASGDSGGALKVLFRALDGRASLRSPVDVAELDVMLATLRHDEAARSQALVTLTRLVPNNAAPAGLLAESEMLQRRFAEAASAYREIIRLEPSNAAARNMLGYALGLAGDLDQARKAFGEYGRLPGQEANSVDSFGEVLFMNGHFAEAETRFLEAHTKNPEMLSGGDLLKAAYAHWLSGDLSGADALFERYVEFRGAKGDATLVWRRAAWLYSTGRTAEAVQLLTNPPAAEAEMARKQLVVWGSRPASSKDNPGPLLSDTAPSELKQTYDKTPPVSDGLVRTMLARSIFLHAASADDRSTAKELLKRWPLPNSAGNPLQLSVMYPLYLDLRKQLH